MKPRTSSSSAVTPTGVVTQPTILLYSGWQTINIGDIGHTPGALRWLEEFCPDAKVILWLANGSQSIRAMLIARFSNLSIVSGSLDGNGESDDPALQAAFVQANVIIYNSGMIFNSFWSPPT